MTETINVIYEPVEADWGVDVGEAGAGAPIPAELMILVVGIGLVVMVGLVSK